MGAFILYHGTTVMDVTAMENHFIKRGFNDPLKKQLGDYQLIIYKKQLVGVENFVTVGQVSLFACGSLFYKKSGYRDSLTALANDYQQNNIDAKQLFGNYFLIFFDHVKSKITVSIDPSFIKNIYFDIHRRIISSDFLALTESSISSYTLNKLAVIENLTTGHLISPDTYAIEIEKLDQKNAATMDSFFQGISLKIFTPGTEGAISDSNDAIKHAQDNLSHYFQSVRNIAEEFGAHIGLTGGFDSRLLLMIARKHIGKLMTNSFWRAGSTEYRNAKKLAHAAGGDFFSFENEPFEKPDKNEMIRMAYHFFDGQFRSQNIWGEEFNIPAYSARIAAGHYCGFHGCGGEQYRNADRIIGKMNLREYIRYEWMFKQCENAFLDKDTEKAVFRRIKDKILRLVDIKDDKVGLLEVKKIQNEIWNTANRATRVNVLNTQMFYFAPFTEYQIARQAYLYVPFLGNSLSFQVNMMKSLDPALAAVTTNYGFDLLEGESTKYKLIPYVVNLIPKRLFYALYFRMRKINKGNDKGEKATGRHAFINSLESVLDLKTLGHNVNLAALVESFDYFLKTTNKIGTVK